MQIPAHFVLPGSLIPLGLSPEYAINFGGHDEVALGQTIDFVGPNCDPDLPPSQ